ncbi:hypothetical protein [Pilimelia columellifera]|uniref:Uncharacterized protein n=1 Tax=Pilimelia columellifera subsp. columellifera TaxID=706583 RepID=A0ABN3NL49_9ACTN
MTRTPSAGAALADQTGGTAPSTRLSSWPVTLPLALFPLWWALGLGALVFSLAAAAMAVLLVRAHHRGRALRLPPGFPLWLVFLATVVAGLAVLDLDPVGVVAAGPTDRIVGAGFRLAQYLAATAVLLYAGNLTRAELPQRRVVNLLAWLFAVTVAGGFLGLLAGGFEFTSPFELVLPRRVRNDGFVQSLVHPYSAQIMDVGAGAQSRPAAPWGYTNTWGNNVCLLVPWLALIVTDRARGRGVRAFGLLVLAAATVPVVFSLNRGLWVGLAVGAGYAAMRLALIGRLAALAAVGAAAAAATLALALTPLGTVVQTRVDTGKSNGVRAYLSQLAVDGMAGSPVVGYGSTRTTLGGRHSITIGETRDCPRCGNFTIGGNGQLWQLLYAHGAVGTVAYLGFFGYALWRFRRDHSPVGIAGGAVIVGSLVAALWYNSLVTPLMLTMIGYALLWRHNSQGENR